MPRCRDTWKPFRRFRCSKRWSWLKAALFNFAMWGCGADLQSSVIWSYPPPSPTPPPRHRHDTGPDFSQHHNILFSLTCLLSLMPSPKSRQWVQRLFVILKYLVKKFRTEYTSSFTTYWWMVTQWASVGQQKVWPPPSPRRSKWRIPVQNCLIILLSSPPLAARLFKASPGGKILPFSAFVRSVGTWQQLNNQKCT